MSNSGVYEFLAQDRVIFGRPAHVAVMDTVVKMGKQRILIVASKTLSRKTDEVSRIMEVLGSRCIGVFDDCIEHVPRESVLALANHVRKLNPDLIVTLGGGTPMDTVKVMLVILAEGVTEISGFDDLRIRVNDEGIKQIPVIKDPPLRQIIIPTTLSGAEFSNIGGCTDRVRQVKDLYTGRYIGAQVVILDAAVTVHTPHDLWVSTGIRAIDHAVETVCSRGPQPFTDATCLQGLKMLSASLKVNHRSPLDLDARLESQLGVWLASTGLGRVEWGASHGIGHQLGAVANVPHGHCSCVMLPSVLAWNLKVNFESQRRVASAMGRDDGDAAKAVLELVIALQQPSRLRDVGVNRTQFSAIAKGAMQNMMVRSNPRPILSESDIYEILEIAW